MMSYAESTRNAGIQAHIDGVDGGSGFGRIECGSDSSFSSILATFTLQKPSYSSPADGSASVLGLPLSTTFSGNGTITHAREVDSDGNAYAAGTVSTVGGGGNYIVTTTEAATGLPVNLVSGTRVWPDPLGLL